MTGRRGQSDGWSVLKLPYRPRASLQGGLHDATDQPPGPSSQELPPRNLGMYASVHGKFALCGHGRQTR